MFVRDREDHGKPRATRPKLMLLIVVFVAISCQQHKSDNKIGNLVLIPDNINWISPSHSDSAHCYANSSLLYFDSSGYFKIIESVFYRHCSKDTINLGNEGWVFYGGEWELIHKDKILIKYKILDRTIRLVNEDIPGEIVIDTIIFLPDNQDVIFQENTYAEYDRFTSSSFRKIRNLKVFESFK